MTWAEEKAAALAAKPQGWMTRIAELQSKPVPPEKPGEHCRRCFYTRRGMVMTDLNLNETFCTCCGMTPDRCTPTIMPVRR